MCRLGRYEVFAEKEVGVYHVYNRTVRGGFLHGVDPDSGVDHTPRRDRFRDRMKFLSKFLYVDVLSFAIMSNHWHCVFRNRPDLVEKLTDREVAVRWLSVLSRKRVPKKHRGKIQESEIAQIVNDPKRVAELRSRLSSISWFVRLMCQTIARECNIEDDCTGRFFEERFKLKRLLDEADVLACMSYVDLNPIRAGLTDSLEGYLEVSIGERLRTLDDGQIDSSSWLAPLELASEVDGEKVRVVGTKQAEPLSANKKQEARRGCLPMRLEAYTSLLWHLALEARPELQALESLTKQKLQTPICLRGEEISIAEFSERNLDLDRRCKTGLGKHTCRVIRERIAAQEAARQKSAGVGLSPRTIVSSQI
ncbi:hypothetical protein FF011L_10910 [Roseimaritima multifibrata]|uniref:Transposase IS200-like domain-containing protein n=1 Tax=Roseimaritima multifibrata TaxID=1930274 RepID=A0A517MBS4_9BACT|nr:hypothetical protein [Roseimaritima multifibrata]QDS92349.1 hypothetical protein FF011L_10910 [Roseimaritima multifibrata]